MNASESESYRTCQSSLPKSQIQSNVHEEPKYDNEEETSSDESILLIRERERGVSLPISMKIDCDEIALRLSTSTPMEGHFYLTRPYELPSPSTHSEPPLPEIPESMHRLSSSSLYDNENNSKPLPSSLNTAKTETTTEASDKRILYQ